MRTQEEKEIKRVVAYLRVSTKGQIGEDRFGLDAQRESIEKFCAKNGYEILCWYEDDGISGANDDRPALNELIYGENELEGVDAVVIAKTDRLARDIALYYAYKNEFRKKGVAVISVQEDFGQAGEYGVILESMMAAMAEIERGTIKRRTSGGRKVKASKGGYSGGRVPYGYEVSDHSLIVSPKEAEMVRVIYRLREGGNTLNFIAVFLNSRGYRTRNGKDFQVSHIQSILRNENTYRGQYHYSDIGWTQGEHTAIL